MTTEPPSCTSHSNNRVDCFVRGTDGAMYDRFWNGLSWEAWAGFGGHGVSGVSAVLPVAELVARSTHEYQDARRKVAARLGNLF
jgi:hypothetical protein